MEKNRLYSFSCILLVHALCFLWTVNGMAQINGANLNGTVTDTSGARVPNAKVEVVAANTGFKGQTQHRGQWSLQHQQPASREVRSHDLPRRI